MRSRELFSTTEMHIVKRWGGPTLANVLPGVFQSVTYWWAEMFFSTLLVVLFWERVIYNKVTLLLSYLLKGTLHYPCSFSSAIAFDISSSIRFK